MCLTTVFCSHDDFSALEELWAGFDNRFNLIIMCEHTDYDDPAYNCATYAILSKAEAFRLAKRLKVGLKELPREICEAMDDWNDIACPFPSDVKDCFKEVTEALLDEGCHFRILRKSGKNGYITC